MKALIIMSNDPFLAEVEKEMDEHLKSISIKSAELKAEIDTKKKEFWDKIEHKLKELSLLPAEYSDKTHSLSIAEGELILMNKLDERGGALGKLLAGLGSAS